MLDRSKITFKDICRLALPPPYLHIFCTNVMGYPEPYVTYIEHSHVVFHMSMKLSTKIYTLEDTNEVNVKGYPIQRRAATQNPELENHYIQLWCDIVDTMTPLERTLARIE